MGRFAAFMRWLGTGVSAFATAVARDEKPLPGHPKGVSLMAVAEAMAGYGKVLNAWELPEAPKWAKDADLALDSASGPGIADLYNWAVGGSFHEGLGFLGYPYLAELSQRPEYRRVTEIWASEATRKWIKFNGDAERIDLLEKSMTAHKVREKFRRLAELDGFFGRGHLFIDLGKPLGSRELRAPLVLKAKMGPGKLKNLKIVEPFWAYPGRYESADPLARDFYKPHEWYVMQGIVHSSRLLTVVGREMPDMLKPAYSFGGLSLSQMVKPYVDNWLRTRQSVSDLLHSFSTMVLRTNMSAILNGGSAQSLLSRLDLYNRTRDNRGIMAVDKDTEELENVSTPLSGLSDLQSSSQEQIASVSGIPLVILLGVTPSGLNASSDGEIRTFYATIKAYQERVFREPLNRVIELLQIDLDGTVDPELTYEFVDLWETPDKEKAEIRKSDADMDVAYVEAGIVSNEEVRARIVQDEDSPYYAMELSDEPPADPAGEDDPFADGGDDDDPDGGGDGNGEPGQAHDAGEWSESKHPRRDDGKFGSGGGGAPSAGGKPEAKPAAKEPHPKVAAILGDKGVARLRELIADKSSKAGDILDALAPLDDAQAEMKPTLPHNQEPDAAFWASRTYKAADGKDMTASQAKGYLANVAAAYADEDGGVGVKRDKQARILLGPPAAGKSTSAEQIARTQGYAIVDGDDAKKVIPEFDGGVGASAVHEESGKLSEQVLLDMLKRGDNVILPLVGGSAGSIERRVKLLQSQGYAVTVDLVHVDEDEAARRMAGRALRTGRHISSGYFRSIGDAPAKTYDQLKSTFKDVGFGKIDGNGGPRDETYLEAVNHPAAKEGMKLFGDREGR